MSAFTTNRSATMPANGFFGSMVAVVAGWNDARMTRKALSKLSDRELDDIGLCRGDIEEIATGH